MYKPFASAVLAVLVMSVGLSQEKPAQQSAPRTALRSKTANTQAAYLEQLKVSLHKQTDFAVFEPNGEKLWANVRQTLQDFLFNEWKSGKFQGTKPEQAYFVKCDRSTMTQNDLDNGRLVVLVGVAPTRPAEFVIFRIGQWTADHRPAKRPHKK